MALAGLLLWLASGTVEAQFVFKPDLSFTPPPIIDAFTGVDNGSIAFADIDGDDDQDVLITGDSRFSTGSAVLYTNDGSGNFTRKTVGTPFTGVFNGSIAFADVDGDNDQDVLITGEDSRSNEIARLYTNDGSGNFTEEAGTPFEGVEFGSIAFADVDGDNDQDVLITGEDSRSNEIARLYTNDGSGNFTEEAGTPFEGVEFGSIAFADVDGDSDPDVLITGYDERDDEGNFIGRRIAKLYTNDGAGNFTEETGTPFTGVDSSSIAFADVDGDNDQDVLITGEDSRSNEIARLYTNEGTGNYTEKEIGTSFTGVSNGSIAFADVDGDNDQDVLITGFMGLDNNGGAIHIAKLYTNDGSGNFTEEAGTPFEGVEFGSIAFADVDGDDDPDVLITGGDNFNSIAKLYTNDGSGNFIEKTTGTPFTGVSGGAIAFADVDGDKDQDVIITGSGQDSDGNFIRIAKLYTNDGSGNFTEETGTPFIGGSSIVFADINGDNDQDVLIDESLYTNDGSGNFIRKTTGTPFVGGFNGSIAFADVDGDNDPDVLITGRNGSSRTAKLYINDGRGNFTEKEGTPFVELFESSIAVADVNGDNDPDVLITGALGGNSSVARLYLGDGEGNFAEKQETPLKGVSNSSIAFADVDGDGDQDVLVTGSDGGRNETSKLYINRDGLGNFIEATGTPFVEVSNSAIAFADVDGDNDPDVLLTGGGIALLYTNNGKGSFLRAFPPRLEPPPLQERVAVPSLLLT